MMKAKKLLLILAISMVGMTIMYTIYTNQLRRRNRLPLHEEGRFANEPAVKIKKAPEKLHGPVIFPVMKEKKPGCQNSSLQSLAAESDDPSIPKIIHWIYADKNVPRQYQDLMKHCQDINKDHIFIFWTDALIRDFLKDHYPDFLYLFTKEYKENLEKSDAARYFLLYHFGGIYIDLDVSCIVPFSKGLKPYQCVIDRERETQTQLFWGNEYSAMNSVMACKRKHPFFLQLMDNLKISVKKEKGILARTGPTFLTVQFERFNKSKHSKSDRVILAPWTLFSPLMDENHIPMFRGICQGNLRNDWQRKGCAEFKRNGYSHGDVKKLTKDSVAIHRYFHLGWGSWRHQITIRLDVCGFVSVYQYHKAKSRT